MGVESIFIVMQCTVTVMNHSYLFSIFYWSTVDLGYIGCKYTT